MKKHLATLCLVILGLTAMVPAYASDTAANVISPDLSTMDINPSQIPADGINAGIVTVTVRNSASQPLSGKAVSVIGSAVGAVKVTPAQATTDANGVATFSITSTSAGSGTISASAQGMTLQKTVTFIYPGTCTFATGQLVKVATNSAVYYYGKDCKRHAFPDEGTYFGWYADFSAVQTIPASDLASMTLGKNVTYHPGYRLVKFPTLPKVYAVSKGGVLHWVSTEAIAKALYDTVDPINKPWNKKVGDLSDAFFSYYTVGSDITQSTQYNPMQESANVRSIDDNWVSGS
ncbi:MAG: invasin domain 3-containing protein [Patescibacteria group bacterium]